MIIGHLENIDIYKTVIPYVEDIWKYLQRRSFCEAGQMQSLSENLKVIYLKDWNRNNMLFETHKIFYDLHWTLKGCDKLMVCTGLERVSLHTIYNEEKDYCLFTGKEDVEVILHSGNWAFISADEPHRNEFVEMGTEKLVFKIRV